MSLSFIVCLDIMCHVNKSVYWEKEVHPDWGFSDFHFIHGWESFWWFEQHQQSMRASIRSNLPCYPVMMVPGDDNNFMPNQPTGGADPQSELILQISHFPILIDSQAANSTTVQTNKVHCFMPTSSCSDVMRSVHCFLFIILVFLSKQVLPCSTSLRSLIFFQISDIFQT